MKKIIIMVIKLFNYMLLLMYYVIPKKGNRVLNEQSNDVLLVSLSGLGDLVIFLDSIRGYRHVYEGKNIVLLTRLANREFACATGYFDEVIGFPDHILRLDRYNSYAKEISFIEELRKRFFYAVVYYGFGKTVRGDLFVKVFNAKTKIKFATYRIGGNRSFITKAIDSWSDSWFDKIAVADKEEMHLIRAAKLIRELGYEDFKADIPHIPMIESVDKLDLSEYIVIFPGSSQEGTRWQWEKFAQVMQYINSKFNIPCVLLGSDSEAFLAEKICNFVKHIDVINLVGTTSIIELSEIIRGASLFIGNDTGPAHIAAGTGTKSIIIMGGVTPGQHFPYCVETGKDLRSFQMPIYHKMDCFGCYSSEQFKHCNKKNEIYECVSSISVETVCEKIDEVLHNAVKGNRHEYY